MLNHYRIYLDERRIEVKIPFTDEMKYFLKTVTSLWLLIP